MEPLVGSKVDIYDNTLDKTVSGHYKTGLIHCRAPWKMRESYSAMANTQGGTIVLGVAEKSTGLVW